MQKIIGLLLLMFVFVFVGCNRDESHIKQMADEIRGDEDAVAIFSLTTESKMPIDDIHIYGFSSSREIKTHYYYSTSSKLADAMLTLDAMDYTFIALVNVGESFAPPSSRAEELPNITLSEFIQFVEDTKLNYTNLLSGMETVKVEKGGLTRVDMEIKEDTEALNVSTLRLTLTLPNGELPDLTNNNTRTHGYSMRATTEVYIKDSDIRYLSYSTILSGHTFDLSLPQGEYDVLLWTDYIPDGTKSQRTDHYYTTSNLDSIKLRTTTPYTANTDSRNAYSLSFETTVGSKDKVTEKTVELKRSLAKYRVIATDVEEYRRLEGADYPPMEDLTVTISYDELPNTFNVVTHQSFDAVTGVEYMTTPQEIDNTTAIIGSDYLFITATESTVSVTISVTDSKGNIITQVSGVEIGYRQDNITIVSGKFLTTDVALPDINISVHNIDDWEEDTDEDGEILNPI